jgi:hypothetical protein
MSGVYNRISCLDPGLRAITNFRMEQIQPRPLSPIAPRPVSVKGAREWDGVTESDRLLKAIVHLARKPETLQTRIALRRLVVRTAREISLDF